jgi:PPP family 3-phenylpropionic acid transporter
MFIAQALHALTFASHHTACIAMVTQHFPGRLRGRGQALFTVIGYGLGGVVGVLAGGALVSWLGYQAMFGVATGLALLGTLCAVRAIRCERHPLPA